MQNKTSFVLYIDQYKPIEKLSLEQKGKILDMIFKYHIDGFVDEKDTLLNAVFDFFKITFDRNAEKYERIKKFRQEAGKKGGKLSKPKQTKTNVSKPKQTETKQASALKSNEYTDDYLNACAFYPKRSGDSNKKLGFKNWEKKIKFGYSVELLTNCIKNYQIYCNESDKTGTEFVKQIPTFFGKDDIFLEYKEKIIVKNKVKNGKSYTDEWKEATNKVFGH